MIPSVQHAALRRGVRFLLIPCGLSLLTGCVAYRPDPIDPEASLAAWRAIDASAATEAVTQSLGAESGTVGDGFDLADGISLAEAEVTALFFNPSIRATRLQIGIPEAEVRTARLWEDPELFLDGEYLLKDVDDPLTLGAGIGITIPISGRLGASKRLAEAKLLAGEAAVVGAEWALMTTLHREWLTLVGLDARIGLLERAISELDELIALAPKFRAAQAVTVVDERLLHIQVERARGTLCDARAQRDEQRLVLLAAMGLHPGLDWKLDARFTDLAADVPEVDDRAMLANPSMRQAMAAYQVAERGLALEVRKQYPDLRIGLGGGADQGDPQIMFGLGLLPIPVWNRNRQGIAVAEVERSVAGMEVESSIQQLVHRRSVAERTHESRERRLRFLEHDLAPLIDQQVLDARRLASLGQLDLFMLADALEQAREVRLEILEARIATRSALAELRALAGPPSSPDAEAHHTSLPGDDAATEEATR